MKKVLLSVLLIIISLTVLVPRFYNLGSQPPGLHIDEVSFAADAKAIAETGRDTWNESWPRVFRAFGEWKAPGLTYSMALWSFLLGKMDTTVARLPSAVAGLAMLGALYYTLILLLGNKAKYTALAATLLLSFSPWHFDMSRIFYEAFSAGTFLAISLAVITYITLRKETRTSVWVLAAALASLAGYWYASVRYVAIGVILFSVVLQKNEVNKKVRLGIITTIAVLAIGIGWIADLASDKGLARLRFYQEKSAFGGALDIDQKRQFCYLSFEKNIKASKPCYIFWNKPLFKVINGAKTYVSYVSPEFLFVTSGSEHGFDGYYGAYLLPILPLYVIGMIQMILGISRYASSWFIKRKDVTQHDIVYTILAVSLLISLFPAAVSSVVTPRMGVLSLYICALAIGIGLHTSVSWLRKHMPRIYVPLFVVYGFTCSFFIIQSMVHYFAVFTRSNDWAWTSDAEDVFSYTKSVSDKYDRIIDTTLHGPLAPYFYGDITTKEVQEGVHSEPDPKGWTYLVKAGKYELIPREVGDLACEKLGTKDTRKTLVIAQKLDKMIGTPKHIAYTWNRVDVMHEVYDLDDVIIHELDHNPSFKTTCTSK